MAIAPRNTKEPTMLAFESQAACDGNDPGAKTAVAQLLKAMGWTDVIDLGDITKSRGTEMLLPLWLDLFGRFGSPNFGFKVVRG